MRIYEGSPRQDFEEVLRSIGAFLDERAMGEILFVELPDGFLVQGLVTHQAPTGGWSESFGQRAKETFRFDEDDIARFLEEAISRRGGAAAQLDPPGTYQRALRVLGRYIDEQRPRDVFFLEQDGAYVLRLLVATQTGSRHVLAEFTREDVEQRIVHGPSWRNRPRPEPTHPEATASGDQS